ncbi:MAG: hypothetical protein D3915_10575 [Candidatus Electrothrix sp. AU1_5]|nr:hypothetical protein [Candidatus Electrothrix gigas]
MTTPADGATGVIALHEKISAAAVMVAAARCPVDQGFHHPGDRDIGLQCDGIRMGIKICLANRPAQGVRCIAGAVIICYCYVIVLSMRHCTHA